MPIKRMTILALGARLGLALFLVQVFSPALADSRILHAAPAAAGSRDCSSWTNPCLLLWATFSAFSGDQVWIKAGVHKPDLGDGGLVRSYSFNLNSGVAYYGGFAGTETNLDQRDPIANVTILSGDIDDNDSNSDGNFIAETTADIVGGNSYNVVSSANVDASTVLDGVIVTAGLADDQTAHYTGGGMFNYLGGSPTLTNVTFSGNWALGPGGGMSNYDGSNPTLTRVTFSGCSTRGSGGGMFNYLSSPTLTSVTFSGNSAFDGGDFSSVCSGGGMSNYLSSPTLTNVTFSGNSAVYGGGMRNHGSNPRLVNVTFSGNSAVLYGGGMRNDHSTPALINTLLWGNSSGGEGGQIHNDNSTPVISFADIQGSGGSGAAWDPALGADGGGNLDADPLLVDADGPDATPGTADDNLRLRPGSPAVNAGDSSAVVPGVTTDRDGRQRIFGGRVDIGAYELQSATIVFRSQGALDGWVLESSSTSNAGGTMSAGANSIRVGDDTENRQYRGILSFDTSGLPDSAVIVSSRLKFKRSAVVGANPLGTHGRLYADMVKGAFSGKRSLQLADFQAVATRPSALTVPRAPVRGWYASSIGTWGRTAINRTSLTQIRLQFAKDDDNDGTPDYLSIFSGNSPRGSRPVLEVTYVMP